MKPIFQQTKAVTYKELLVKCNAFGMNELIPAKYTCDGKNTSPAIDIEDIPEEAKCLALVVEDPDAPIGVWTHWLAWNIPVTHHLKENSIHGVQGINDFRNNHYGGPCPPPGKAHRYFFKLYALDALLDLKEGSSKKQLERAMSDHIIGFGELIGLYQRK